MDRVLLAVINLLVIASAAISPGPWWLRTGIVAGVPRSRSSRNKLLESVRDNEHQPPSAAPGDGEEDRAPHEGAVRGLRHTHIGVGERTRKRIAAPTAANPGTREPWYFNTGSWTSTSERGLTHVCILVDDDKPQAELRRWCPDSNRPLKVIQPALAG